MSRPNTSFDLQPFLLGAGFLAGLNTVDFQVTNLRFRNDLGNPVGLLVELPQASIPEPGSLLLLGTGILLAARRIRGKHGSARSPVRT